MCHFLSGRGMQTDIMKKLQIVAVLSLTLCATSTFAQEIWTIGPMFHINFGGEKRSTAFSIEAAYWNITHFIYSVDVGLEIERGKLRVYSEGQTGLGVTGISLGPVVEFNFPESKIRLGVQGSCWINYILGVDYRIRFIDNKKFNYIGLYGKLPVATSGLEGGDGSTSYDDWDDWD
jgi:hypothetical protein